MQYLSEYYLDVQELNEIYNLMESARTKMIRSTRQTQLKRAGARQAMRIAKESDPMYRKYMLFRKKYLKLKKKMLKKYGNRGFVQAKKSLG